MSLTTTVQSLPQPEATKPIDATDASALLSMALISIYAAQKSNRKFRKLKRRFLWTAFVLKTKSRFSKKAATSSDRTLLYILLGVVFLIILILNPWVALFLALILIILLLTGTINL